MKVEQNETNSDSPQLDEVDAKIAALMVETPAATDQEIADKLGMTRQTVNRRRNAKPVRERVSSALSLPEKEVRRLTAKALVRLESFLDHEDPKIQLAATLARSIFGNDSGHN
jgi:predicted transcriptional regulator